MIDKDKMTFRKDGDAVYIVGKSRSGKTALAQHLTANIKRKLIWDSGGLWATAFRLMGIEFEIIEGAFSLAKRLKQDKSPGIICYRPEAFTKNIAKEFDFFAGCAFLWIKQSPGAVIVEEAAEVLTPGAAAGNWRTLQNQAQKYGGAVYVIMQRPQEGDKTSMTQATDKYIFKVEDHEKRYMLEKFNVPENQVPDQPLKFIHIDRKGDKYKGYIDFNGQPEQGANPAKYRLKTKKVA